jgi:hypothetical protein
MDVTTFAKNLATFLTPLLSSLLNAGEKAIEEVGKKFGAATWDLAKALWGKIRPKMEAKPAALEAAEDAAAMPHDEDIQAALRLQLEKLLAEDNMLTKKLEQLWDEAKRVGMTIMAIGERSVAAQKIEDSTIITGDRNVVKQ